MKLFLGVWPSAFYCIILLIRVSVRMKLDLFVTTVTVLLTVSAGAQNLSTYHNPIIGVRLGSVKFKYSKSTLTFEFP